MSYRKYTSLEGIEIRVGRNAQQNETLSLESKPFYGWCHADGPGAHVVVCFPRETNRWELWPETLLDACVLAAHFSKKRDSQNSIQITIAYCENVEKKKGTALGEVHLKSSSYSTIDFVNIHLSQESERIRRLFQPGSSSSSS